MATVSRLTDITSVSELGFDDAVRAGLGRARQTLRGLDEALITRQEVLLGSHGRPDRYKVTLRLSFVLDGQSVTELAPYPDAATQLADSASGDEADR
jgi:dodecin